MRFLVRWLERELRRLTHPEEFEPYPSLRQVAVNCGLADVVVAPRGASQLSGRFQTSQVTMRFQMASKYQPQRLAIVVETPVADDDRVSLRLESDLGRAERQRVAPEIDLATTELDDLFYIAGSPARIRALLDGTTRQRLLVLAAEARIEASGGRFSIAFPADSSALRGVEVSRLLRNAIALGRHLAGQLDLPRRLAENAASDPEPAVRRANLLTLLREFPETPAAATALATARADHDPSLRLAAAIRLGAEGRELLRELAGERDEACAAAAIEALGHHPTLEERLEWLEQALRGRRLEVARVCLEGLARERAAAALDSLIKVLGVERGALAVVAARALGSSVAARSAPQPAAEALTAALGDDDEELRLAAVAALGKIGSVDAIPTLRLVAGSGAGPELERAVRQAIADIRGRRAGAAHGQLSLAVAGGGELALADADRGRLSLTAPAAGRLSVTPVDAEASPPGDRRPPSGG